MNRIYIKFFILCLLFSSSVYGINDYSYDKTGKFDKNFCNILHEDLKSTNVPNSRYFLSVDLQIDNIANIDSINNTFEAYYSLWVHWKDKSLVEALKKSNSYYPKEKYYLCSFEPEEAWDVLFDPVIEFYENKPNSILF